MWAIPASAAASAERSARARGKLQRRLKHRFARRGLALDHVHVAHEVVQLRVRFERRGVETREVFADGQGQAVSKKLALCRKKRARRAKLVPGRKEVI